MEDHYSSNTSLISPEATYPRWELLMAHQAEVIRDPHRFKVLVWHRRARKTTTALTELVKQALFRVGVYWHVFPTKTDGKDAIWKDPQMLFRIIPKELIERQNEVETTIYLKNGSVIIIKGADEPDTLRGSGPVGVVLDEFAKMKYEAWQIIEPILRANDGWCWFIGTPMGKNHLYKMYLLGQQPHHEWKSWLLKASNSGIIRPDQLEETRLNNPEAHFNQEYECEFLEGEGAVFRGVREIANAIPHQPLDGHYYVCGVDLAKYQDFTVITVYDRQTNSQVFQDRFQTIEWPFQKKRIKRISDHYNKALVILDSTGVGDPIFDDLARAGVPIESFKFTQQSKKDLVEKLSIYIEQRRIRILNIEESLVEFDNFVYEMGPTGQMRYNALPGFHDDIVIAHGLAIWSLNPLFREETIKPKTRIQQYYERKTEDYEQGDNAEVNEWNEWSSEL